MSFNRDSVKRLCSLAGVERFSHQIIKPIEEETRHFISSILNKSVVLCAFMNRKTITTEDLNNVSKFRPDLLPQFIVPSNLNKQIKVCATKSDMKNALKGRKSYCVYTRKKPFQMMVREFLPETFRLGKDIPIILQLLAEKHIIDLLHPAGQISKTSLLGINEWNIVIKTKNEY